MATTVAELVARLNADVSGFRRGMSDANRTLDQSANRLRSFGDSATAMGRRLTLGVTLPFIAAAAAGFRELQESQKQAAITKAHIESTGGVANVTAKHIDKMATALMNLSGVDDEQIKAGQNMLLTFKAVRNEVGKGNKIFDRATKASLDLSFQFGSTDSAAKQLGKALADPVRGITALRRAGVDFTQAQKDQIAAFVEAGDLLSAQKIILKEVESQVGGTAKAYGKTLVGQISLAKETLKNSAADILVSVAPAIKFLGKVIKGVADFLKDMPGWAKTAFAALATGAAILGPLLLVVGAIARNLAAIKSFRAGSSLVGLGGAAGGIGAGGAAAGGAAAGMGSRVLGGATKALGVVGIAVAVGELAQALNTSQMEKAFKPLENGAKFSQKAIRDLREDFENFNRSAVAGATGTGDSRFSLYRSQLRELRGEFTKVLEQSPDLARKWLEQAAAVGFPTRELGKLQTALNKVEVRYDNEKAAAERAEYAQLRFTGAVTAAGGPVKNLEGKIIGYNTALGFIPKDKITTFHVNKAPAEAGLSWLRSKLIGVGASFANARIGAAGYGGGYAGSGGGAYLRFAEGGVVPGLRGSSPMAWVGERGPELVSLPAGSRVHTSDDSRKMASGGIVMHFHIAGSVVSERQLMDVVREGLRRDKRQGKGGI